MVPSSKNVAIHPERMLMFEGRATYTFTPHVDA